MADIRLHVTFNRDLPGAMENVHPNKFIANLRPVEEFRHTPIIPISEKELKELEKLKAEKNRQGYFVELKKDTLYYYAILAFLFMSVMYVFYITNEQQMTKVYEIDKVRTGRYNASLGRQGATTLEDRKTLKMVGQK